MDADDGDGVDAQAEYDANVDALQELLTRAAESPTVHRERGGDGDEAADGAAWVDRLRSGSRLREHDHDGDDVGGPATSE